MTYIITKVYETRAGVSVVISSIEEEKTLLLKKDFWLKSKFNEGDEINDKDLDYLEETVNFCKALARADNLLAQSDYSCKRLIEKLKHYGFDDETCRNVSDYVVKKGYIKEKEQCERITKFFCIRKHWGKRRIAAELMGRGYNRSIIMSTLDVVTEEQYHESLVKLVQEKYKRPSEDYSEKQRRIAAMTRMGYSVDEILRAFDEVNNIYISLEEAALDD